MCTPSAQVWLVSEPARRAAVGDLVIQSVEQSRAARAFFRELADWLLPNGSSRPLGMTGDTRVDRMEAGRAFMRLALLAAQPPAHGGRSHRARATLSTVTLLGWCSHLAAS